MKVITFSRHFPSYHPKAGQPTYFVEKIWAHLVLSGQFDRETCEAYLTPYWCEDMFDMYKVAEFHDANTPKIHTIREGHRWKEGEQFSPRVWSGRPYFSKQIVFAPPLTVEAVAPFGLRFRDDWQELAFSYNDNVYKLSREVGKRVIGPLAQNDGLSLQDFTDWFSKSNEFSGQIIYF